MSSTENKIHNESRLLRTAFRITSVSVGIVLLAIAGFRAFDQIKKSYADVAAKANALVASAKEQEIKERAERDKLMWEDGRQYGYYQSFIEVVYACNEYSAVESGDSRVIYHRVTSIQNPHKGVK